eukprot:2288179-Prymnesium_polylepis.1
MSVRLALCALALVTASLASAQTCTNTCVHPSDGDCDDGGAGSEYSACAYGSDCADCGGRASPPPAPPHGPRCTAVLDLVLVLDKSGSMSPYEEQVESFANYVLSQFLLGSAAARVAIVFFSSSGTLETDLDADRAASQAAINSYRAGGLTHISAGLERAVEVLQSDSARDNAQPVIFLLSDG